MIRFFSFSMKFSIGKKEGISDPEFFFSKLGMRRFTRRRKTLAAISAIMGRLGKSLQNTTRPIFKVHYRKLDDEYNQNHLQQHQEQLKCMSTLPEYMSYCCCQCGHTQKLKVSSFCG